MKCQYCGAELDDGVLFCKDCGAKVEIKKVMFCRECGSKLEDGVKFCSNCGAATNTFENLQNSEPKVVSTPTYTRPEKKDYDTAYSTGKASSDDPINRTIKNISNKFSDGLSGLSKKNSNKNWTPLIVLAVVLVFALVLLNLPHSDKKDKGETLGSQISIPETLNESGTFTIEAGTQYAFMSDEWNVYIANAISDSVIKIEHWDKTFQNSKELKYSEDIGTYKINDENNGFGWIDKDHTAFVFTFQDKNNSHAKKAIPRVFTININNSDKFKGSDYDESIACYSYTCDDWHMYRAIPLTESLIKIECWVRTSSLDNFCFGWDWCVIDWTNTDTDFAWTDDSHKGFTITTQDVQNKSYWKEDTFVAFMLENEGYVYSNVKSYLGKNTSTAEKTSSDRDQKNGYDEKSNSVVKVGNFYFSIPSYWSPDITEADHYRAYAETSGKTAVLEIFADEDKSDPVTYDILKKETDSGAMTKFFETWFEKCEGTTSEAYDNGNVKGFIYRTNFTQGAYEGQCTNFCFPSESDNKWVFVTLTLTNNTTYKYDNDFQKVLGSISAEANEKKDNTVTSDAGSQTTDQNKTDSKAEDKKDQTTEEKKIPTMSGATLKAAVDKLKELGVTEVYDDDFGHGTRMKALSDKAGGLMIDIIYTSETKEIMCASITTNKLATSKEQKAFVKGIAEYICPSDDASTISSWVSSNVGKAAEKELNGFTYELSLGPVDNILFYAGEREWEAWDLSQ